MCDCGCVNFNYLDPQDPVWRCRNCQRVLSFDFPRLMEKALDPRFADYTCRSG